MNHYYPEVGIAVPRILLPKEPAVLAKWPVVACDQFTSQPEYWEKAAQIVGDAPSTLHIIFPEVYLGKGDDAARISRIQRTMREYLDTGVLAEYGPGMVYVERRTIHGRLRKGLVLAVDLECYDFMPGAETLIRATEGTVLERIPPRVRIREGAPLESPHVMLLIDDPEDSVFGEIAAYDGKLSMLYDVELMLQGGRVTGYRVDDSQLIGLIIDKFRKLADTAVFNRKYGLSGRKSLLFAVGDGNHSLATAKAVWERVKERISDSRELADHPARFALVEVVNLHDPALEFEPIHRVLFGVAPEKVLEKMARFFGKRGASLTYRYLQDVPENPLESMDKGRSGIHRIGFVTEAGKGCLEVTEPPHTLEVGTLQLFIDALLKEEPEIHADYIHGDDVVGQLGSQPGNMGFYLSPMDKGDLFKTVILNGVLPRKTFSMGEAEEKRYYMECRRLAF